MSLLTSQRTIMNPKEITDLLLKVPDELLLPIESILERTIADTYRQLQTVPIGELNALIDIERANRELPVIPWAERGTQTWLSDLLVANIRANNYAN